MAQIQQKGFTIVELLIVIVVIGILAAIVIVAFNGVQNRANDTTVRNDLKNISKQMELWRVDQSDGSYPKTTNDLTTMGMKLSKNAYETAGNNLTFCIDNSLSTPAYAVIARSKSGNGIYYTSTGSGNLASWSGTAQVNCLAAGVEANSPGWRTWGYSSSAWNLGI